MKKKYIFIYSVYAILLAVFTFMDLKVSKTVYNPHSIYGNTFAILGELPIYIGITLFGLCAYRCAPKLFKWFGLGATFVGSILLIIMPARYLLDLKLVPIIVCSLCGIAIGFDGLFLSKLVKEETWKKLMPILSIWFVLATAGPGINGLIKLLFGRVRFINLKGDYSNYTRWYHINGFTGNYSFPSGHTVGSATLLALNAIPLFLDIKKSKRLLIGVLTYAFVALTACSRIVLGMHYVTDVITGFILCYTLKEVVTHFVYKYRQSKII